MPNPPVSEFFRSCLQTARCGVLLLMCAAVSLTSAAAGEAQTSKQPDVRFRAVPSSHLPNLWQIHSRVYSGGLPDGPAAFEELRDLGIRTIISVDGLKPDADTAR